MNDAERIEDMRQLLTSAEKAIESAKKSLEQFESAPQDAKGDSQSLKKKAEGLSVIEDDRVIEGVFDGQNMIGPDGKQYPVPANYASKSKLVEGDILKLTITDDGSFVYKQIGPIDRKKVIGKVLRDGADWRVIVDGKYYRILLASITYYKAEEGDEIVVILPKAREATWAAVENLIRNNGDVNLEVDEPFADSEDQFAGDDDKDDAEDESKIEVEEEEKEKKSGKKDDEDEFSLTF